MGSYRLLEEALEGGVRLVATSPGYRDTYTEREVGGVLERFPEPVFVMTQVPTGAWTEGSRTVAFHRGLRESLGRLRRGNVEGLLIRNAEPGQLTDPEFREFAAQVKESGYVERIGVSGHGTDLEKVLEIVADDPLYEIVLFAAYLVRYEAVPPLLARAAEAGKILVAMKARELAMEDRLPGWEKEAERQRHVPWDGRWGESFTRRALVHALAETPAANALVSIREREDVAVAVDASEPEGG
jgi:aryl-alcohol dehydrogenase-like predicted oxidoreductase